MMMSKVYNWILLGLFWNFTKNVAVSYRDFSGGGMDIEQILHKL